MVIPAVVFRNLSKILQVTEHVFLRQQSYVATQQRKNLRARQIGSFPQCLGFKKSLRFHPHTRGIYPGPFTNSSEGISFIVGFWGSLGYLLPGYMGKIIDLWNNHTIQSFIFKSVPMGSLSGIVGISTCMYPKKIYQMNRQICMDPISVQKDLQLPPSKQLTCQWKHTTIWRCISYQTWWFSSLPCLFLPGGTSTFPPFFSAQVSVPMCIKRFTLTLSSLPNFCPKKTPETYLQGGLRKTSYFFSRVITMHKIQL